MAPLYADGSSLLFMSNVKRTPVVLSSATLTRLHCFALQCVASRWSTMYYTWLHCTALHNMRWRKSRLQREKCDVTKIRISEIMGLVACSDKKRRIKYPCQKSGCYSDNCWFSLDVTKIETKKISILPRFYFHDALEQLKTNFHTNFGFKRSSWFSYRVRLNF